MTAEAASKISGGEARRVARNAGAIAAARLISSAVLFGWQLALAVLLSKTDLGINGTVMSLFAVGVPLASFSMGLIVIRDVARQPQRAGQYLSATLFIQTILALLAYIGINGAAVAFGYESEIRAFVGIAGLSLFVDLLGNLCYDQLLARERMITTSLVDVLHIFIRIGLAALMLLSGYGLLGVYAATLTSGLIRSGWLASALWRSGVRPAWPLERTVVGPLLVNSAPLALSAFLSLAYQHADKLMTTSLIGAESTADLVLAFVIIYGVVELLSTTILVATYPMMSRAYTSAEGGSLYGFIVQKLAFFTLLISLPLALVLTVFSDDLIVPFLGQQYAPAAQVLSVLIWYALLTMIGNVFAQALMVQNRQRRLLVVRASGLTSNILLNLLFIPRFGVTGAALASVCAEALVLTLMLTSFRGSGWSLRPFIPRLLRLGLLAVVVVVAMLALGGVSPVLGMGGGLLLYAGGVLLARVLAADDWDLLYRLTAAMPGGALILRYWRRDVTLGW
jgi:O-antigen/teichoic acid export membrane protein